MKEQLPQLLGWLASCAGLAGAFLLATHGRHARYGWICFLCSNVCWLAFALQSGTISLLVQTLGFMITTALGIRQWFFVDTHRRRGTSTAPTTWPPGRPGPAHDQETQAGRSYETRT